jgi:diguanylate cyclase (GGDEF)-like protein
MEKTYHFNEYQTNKVSIGNDNANGGKSKGKLEVLHNKIMYQCQTKNTPHTFAYCGINIQLGPKLKEGVNLQSYDVLEFTLAYQTSEHDTLLIYLTNLENTGEKVIHRDNMHTVLPKEGIQKVHLKLNNFSVPSWWVLVQKTAVESNLTNFDNITKLRIVSGDNTQERTINFSISNIVLKGKWIKADTLYLSLLIIWLLIISFNSLTNFKRIRKAYLYKEQESKALQSLNTVLADERKKFENLAKTDPLTHCYNREGTKDIIEHQINLFVEQCIPCSLILLDIDNFKDVNDQFGHNEGDLVLVNMANLIHNNIKAKDSLARWGGEEFLIICSNTALASAILLAESLRILIESTNLSQKTQITSSFGVTQFDSNDFESCFKRADENLYKAKSLGRNNIQAS